MKKLFTLLLSSVVVASAIAQTVTITFNGNNKNRNYELILDDVSYFSNSSTNVITNPNTVNAKSKVTITDLEFHDAIFGTHLLQIKAAG